MNTNEFVKVLRACGSGDSACKKCPFYIEEDSSECRFNAIYEAADHIETLQEKIPKQKNMKQEVTWPRAVKLDDREMRLLEYLRKGGR